MGMAVLGNGINIGLAIAMLVLIIIIYKALFPTTEEIEAWKKYKSHGSANS